MFFIALDKNIFVGLTNYNQALIHSTLLYGHLPFKRALVSIFSILEFFFNLPMDSSSLKALHASLSCEYLSVCEYKWVLVHPDAVHFSQEHRHPLILYPLAQWSVQTEIALIQQKQNTNKSYHKFRPIPPQR